MIEKNALIRLLQDTVEGLSRRGYKEIGRSEVFRIMRQDYDKTTIKLFLDNYDDPNYIVVRFSDLGYEGENNESN